jgi:uncharacterized protein (TIGR02145 family)
MRICLWLWSLAFVVVAICACSDSDSLPAADSHTGVLVDPRDSQTYKTVEIGGRVWMAENLNYRVIWDRDDLDTLHGSSWCYNDSAEYCEKRGRLYQWDEALYACPGGWKFPSKADFDSLIYAVGGFQNAADSLISRGFITDIQGGYYFMGYFSYFDEYAYFWTSDEVRGRNARSVMFAKGSSGVSYDETYEEFALSVRCVRSTN